MNSAAKPNAPLYDVVVVGGSLSGAATATLLLRKNPGLKLLIVEKSTHFTRRVGEATVEVSAFFLGRILGMTQHLNESHLVKQGMRFWFTNKEVASLDQASELGGRYQVRLPSYQLDRAVFDEEVLRRACGAGATLLRPASVTKVHLTPGGEQIITLRTGESVETVRARWVLDASGVAALLARQEGWWQCNDAHPIAAAWGRWKGVKDWDGYELAQKYPEWACAPYGIRGTATNHVVGDGWWSWWIPLKGGDVSVGVVFDQRLVQWPRDGGRLGDRLKQFLMQHPVAREILADAVLIEGDVHWRKDLAYFSTKFAGDGFVLVGDAAGFIDPFYSPGMDWISFTAVSAAELVTAQRRGEPLTERIEHHNKAFSLSYHRWFQAVYQDKYEYMGEYDLMRLAFLLDLGLYYLGIVAQPFRKGMKGLLEPPFSEPLAQPVFALMRVYNRRFAQIARRRRRLDLLGRTNHGQRYLASGFTLSRRDIRLIAKTVLQWGWLELKEGWHTWPEELPVPVSVSVGKRQAIEPSSTVKQKVASASVSVSVSEENTSG
jgi:flavin-dependent dehydrogenase